MKTQMKAVTAPVETWRYWARTITEKCGWNWESIEWNERISAQLRAGVEPEGPKQPISGLGEAVYWAMEHAKDAPLNIAEEAARELLARLLPLAECRRSRDNDAATRATGDFCNVCRRFPASLRRLRGRPAPDVPVKATTGQRGLSKNEYDLLERFRDLNGGDFRRHDGKRGSAFAIFSKWYKEESWEAARGEENPFRDARAFANACKKYRDKRRLR